MRDDDALAGVAREAAARLDLIEALFDALNRHDIDGAMTYFDEDCIFESHWGRRPWGRRVYGRDAVRSAFTTQLARIPDAQYVEAQHWLCGELGVSEWTLIGIPPTGEPVWGCDLWEFRDGKISRRNSFRKEIVARGASRPEPGAHS